MQAHLISGPLPDRILRKAAGSSFASLTAQRGAGHAPPPPRKIGGQVSPTGGDDRDQAPRNATEGRAPQGGYPSTPGSSEGGRTPTYRGSGGPGASKVRNLHWLGANAGHRGKDNRANYPSFTHSLDPVSANDSALTSRSWDCMRHWESSSAMTVLLKLKTQISAAGQKFATVDEIILATESIIVSALNYSAKLHPLTNPTGV